MERSGKERARPPSRGMQPDQLRKLTRKWAIPIILVTILGALGSYLVSKRLTPIYQATGRVLIVAAPGSSGRVSQHQLDGSDYHGCLAAYGAVPPSAGYQRPATAYEREQPFQGCLRPRKATRNLSTSRRMTRLRLAAAIANALMTVYVAQITQANQARIDQGLGVIQDQSKLRKPHSTKSTLPLTRRREPGRTQRRHALL